MRLLHFLLLYPCDTMTLSGLLVADKRGLTSFWGDKNAQELMLLINVIVSKKWDGPSNPDVITQGHWRIWGILCRKTSPIPIRLGPSISFWEVETTWLRDLRARCMNSCHRWLKSFVFQSWFHCVSSSSVQKVLTYFRSPVGHFLITDKTCRPLDGRLKKAKV